MTGIAQYIGPDGKAIANGGAPTLGFSFDPDPRISALRLVQGTRPTTPDDLVMDLGTAQKYHFTVGQGVRVLLPGPTHTFTITGIARFGTADNLAGATLAVLRHPDGAEALRRGRASSTTSTSSPNRVRTRRPSPTARPRACRAASRWSPARPCVNEATGAIGSALELFQHGAVGLRLHRASSWVGSPSSIRSPSSWGQRIARAGAPAHRRGEPAPGLPVRPGRGGGRGPAVVDRRSRPRCARRLRARKAAERLWGDPAIGPRSSSRPARSLCASSSASA